jgi:hypothetical protein
MDPEQLSQAIRRQVEYYFSKENLQQDAYLTSHMDANMSVPISVIMKFAKMKALTQDEAVIVKALEHSTVSIIDGRIKANVKSGGRSTIILRDIPSDAPEDEVREIFSYDGSKSIVSIRSEIGDSWFIVMESEEDAKDTLIDLRLKKRMFRGQSVKGRMKTETIVRSFYPVQTAPVAFGGMPYGFPAPMGVGFGYPMMPNGMPAVQAPPMLSTENLPNAANSETDKMSAREEPSSVPMNTDAKGSASARGEKKPVAAAVVSGVQPKPSVPSTINSARDNSALANKDRRPLAVSNGVKPSTAAVDNKDKKAASRPSTNAAPKKDGKPQGPAVEISPANFPPLMVSQSSSEDTPIPTPGYKTSFLKYSFDEVINIVKAVQDTTLPETIKPADHPLSMTVTPNLDLLQRQRTFSIDETREQLRQGKPVQQMAVASGGANDYSSMIYGDGYSSDAGQSTNVTKGKNLGTSVAANVKKAGTGSWAALVATPAASQPALPAASSASHGTSSPQSTVTGATASSSSATSWKRGDKPPAPVEKPVAASVKSPEKKPAAPAADSKKKGDKPKKEGKVSMVSVGCYMLCMLTWPLIVNKIKQSS